MKIQNFYANNLYEWAMSQYLPTSNFEKLYFPEEYELDQFVEDLRFIPVGNEYDYFKESDIEYPAEIREKNRKLSTLSLSNKSRSRVVYNVHEQCETPITNQLRSLCVT